MKQIRDSKPTSHPCPCHYCLVFPIAPRCQTIHSCWVNCSVFYAQKPPVNALVRQPHPKCDPAPTSNQASGSPSTLLVVFLSLWHGNPDSIFLESHPQCPLAVSNLDHDSKDRLIKSFPQDLDFLFYVFFLFYRTWAENWVLNKLLVFCPHLN